jgi:predicted O-methyltransferase YrrM
MNKLAFFLSVLKYSITNPLAGKELFKSKFQTWEDSKNKDRIFDYGSQKMDLGKILKKLFPNEDYSISNFEGNTMSLQQYAHTFFNNLQPVNYPSKAKPYPLDYTLDNTSGFFLYSLCKLLKPDKVVETGVAYGLSSMYILQALYENKKGVLYSIDFTFSPWQSQEMIGAAIPDNLRSNWKLIFGPSSKELYKLLSSIHPIDIFFHDSLHTFKNMISEFEIAWPYLKHRGFLISDDISSNNAFYKFYSKLNLEPLILPQNFPQNTFLGILKKP